MNNEDNSVVKRKKKNFRYIIGGDILAENFIFEQSKLLILILVLIVFFISNKYSCMKKLVEVETLREQLKDIKYENLSISAELAFRSRLSQVEKLLKSREIELSISETPAFELHKK
ncbi:MAG: FtsL-like putative cell division protein [Candidatus Azobacteroides pseudotrichonymphae]|jgi:predicted membrane protein|uniref:Cell division protein FtsL n=1 Tax=Azobacteroides pseudotrichonymphae genomovar. CFP2 TaxID=511995 RepID=B6YS32_AZOPC|nr:FtsL-like putative cell division protein [Candidatus Azobacteroides pseudotrichonymphae]MDR0530437.1 hypothetical protein [Bacteroidales bacterium OttesenSCG-928-I14]BAG84004.1 conserved hypothetical protein [Candidatus Azobacteroides pseudotrichonymphae genomovar. CFP2]GMO33668.1 MAG: FtsL-like putative cell division protein [Candidatus Azobacteroides pseudotrichonymphae]